MMSKWKGNTIFTPESLCEHASSTTKCIDGKWVPARPIGFDSIIERFKNAWAVFQGKYDLVKWYKQ